MTTEQRLDRIEQTMQLQADSLLRLTDAIGVYADSANARMKRIEENLDGLIRAITAEHSNGKGKH